MKNRKIAVIDNDKKLLGEVKKILVLGGYAPVLVGEPASAVDSVIHHKPDVILMDLKILRSSGCELTNVINLFFEKSRMPIIVMSEFVRDEFKELLNLFGIRSYLRKPFHPLDVIWAIENEIREGNRTNGEPISIKAVYTN